MLWNLLGGKGTQPPVPWCAVKFEAGMPLATLIRPKDLQWFGSFERDLAWGWHELAATTALGATSDPASRSINMDGRTRLLVYSQTYGKLRDFACRVDRSAMPKSGHRRNPWA